MLTPDEESNNSNQVRSSSRERNPTEKGKEMHVQEAKKHEKIFGKAYETWKRLAKEIRTQLKGLCSPEELNDASHCIRAQHNLVKQNYEPIRRNHSMTPDIVKRMDACTVITTEICELIQKRIDTIEETFNDQLEKERVRIILNKNNFGSVFGDTKTETSAIAASVVKSKTSDSSGGCADAEAELAAKVEQAKVTKEILAQEAKLTKIESDWKMKEYQAHAALKRQEVEIKIKLEEEKTKLQQLKADSEVKVASARVNAYNALNGSENTDVLSHHSDKPVKGNAAHQPSLNAQAPAFQPFSTLSGQQELNLVQTLASSLTLNRLPVPEPAIFTGDPLKFMDWKISYMALIGSKPLPVCEKMYLKSYLAGEAKKAVEGYFFRNSDQAYQGIWNVLQERYGCPFIIQRAFRTKLMKWPKIPANDPLALREFADFLQSCAEAIPQVKGLDILNDCEENHKLLKKLPDWIVRSWSRIVVDELDKSEEYPSFAQFTNFLQKEAKVACSPIASPFLMAEKASDERFMKRAKVLNTTVQTTPSTPSVATLKPKPPCLFCSDNSHGIVKCSTFAEKASDEKTTFIRENHLCFGCLRKGHVTKECKARHSCGKCGRRHPTCLHTEKVKESKTKETEVNSESANKEVHKVMAHVLTRKTSATSSIVPVFVSTASQPQKEILTYALLDTQSDSSFILGELATELDADSKPVQLKLSTMTSVDTVVASKLACNLKVRGFDSDAHVQVNQAYSRDFIPVDKSHIPTRETALQWPHLQGLGNEMKPLQDCDVGLLIGYDCPSALAPLEVVTGKVDEPFAQRTILGWSIIGSANPHLDRQGDQSFVHRVTVKEIHTPLATDVLKVLESDFNERNYEDKYVSQDDVRFIQLLSDTIVQRPDGHYEMPLPFKDNHSPALPNNKRLATVRLQHLEKRLRADKLYREHYIAFMNDTINNGDAELAPLVSERETVWYIPHHGVYHPKKPTKLRVVFDASAKFRGISLNDTLLTGPDMMNSLVGVLCRFRRQTVAVICDIQKMFHQFFVSPEMRNYLRFLWWENGQLDTEPKEYRMAVHLFGASSSPGCANFGLKYLARQHKSDYPKASAFVEKNFYVDDGLTSVPSVKEARELITESQELCKLAGLRLHKFNSNHEDALSHLTPSERADTATPLNLKPDSSRGDHVLGIKWSVENDTFSFNTSTKEQPPTRRSILSVISSLFDPLGFVAPFTLSGKSILQELCRRNIGWDDPIPENLCTRWEEWKKGLQTLKTITVQRCYHPPDFDTIARVELHHFSDASNVGYGACSYLRYKNGKNQVYCSLVIAKSRVAPTKVISIPRLELSAAVTSAKLSVVLNSELEMHIDDEHFWTDSKVVLAYINNEARRFHVFVSNRVQLIRQTTDPKQWHYICTTQNPADHASRGLSAAEITSTNWLSGPKFLWEPDISFPSNTTAELLVGDPEVKTVRALTTRANNQSDILSRLARFSSWSTLLKVIARINRLRPNKKHHSNLVTVEERKDAADTVIRLLQQQAFSQELERLRVGENLPCTSPIFRLDPILDQGLLRLGGRLKKSTLSQGMKHPLILPKEHCITTLIMSHYHSKICHQGRSQTLMELRVNGFWVIGGSKQVAKLINKCVLCRKLRRPTEEQRMSELPKERIEVSEPFMYCGMDCFGPFITKQGRKENKRYGLLLTCLSSRAVHIEMLEDLSTDIFINALRCFISLRGAVCKLYCDQGTNFVGAKNELKEAFKQCDTDALEAFLVDQQCQFVFNAPSASHAGGVWERQIRTIRNVLNATISQCAGRLDDASLRTLFYEAMSIINGRPLSVDGINDPKSPEPLTPNHLILMKSKVALPPPGKFVKEDLYARKRWRRVQYLTEQFWSRWKKEYLLNISTRQKWHVPRRNLKVNDIVIIKDVMLQRSQWQLGRVVEAPEEDDGFVRRVKIQLGNRDLPKKRGTVRKPHIVERPVQKLVVLVESH